MRMAFLTLSLLAAGCADQGEFPSLARRPVEKAGLTPPPPPPVVPGDPELAKRITFATEKARDGVEAFDVSLGAAQTAVARAGADGSETWIAAQLAVSQLETTLTPAREALSELDGERRGVVVRGSAADAAALETAITEVETIDRRQAEETRKLIDALNR